MKEQSYVIVTEAPKLNYLKDFVALPENYGSLEYFEREDVKAIRNTVFKCLDDLESKTKFSEKLKNNKKVLIKPNLVGIFHESGYSIVDSPQSTDPRVFEAVICYLKKMTENVVIIESSGGGSTYASFKTTGYDRIADYYNTGLIALEGEPVTRYMVPKAEVQKEVYIPQIIEEIINGEAFYVSVPKMKTNIYTGVTLGFKNAMGTLPYMMRERNHTYDINKKLVDLLYLFKPDLTVIDGIIGGEGDTPAPVDPVEVGVIISGNNSVETDRVATRMMGFDPDKNLLMVEAVKRGFNDPEVTIIGNQKVVPFKPAENSFLTKRFRDKFPNITTLVGFSMKHAPKIADVNQVSPETVVEMEAVCAPGCIATLKFCHTNYEYMTGVDYKAFDYVLILGNGVEKDGIKYYFDVDGKPYTTDEIRAMERKKMAVGECVRYLEKDVDYYAGGCCSPQSIVFMFREVKEAPPTPNGTMANKSLYLLAEEQIKLVLRKRQQVNAGLWIDAKRVADYRVGEIPELSPEEMKLDYIKWPLGEIPEDTKAEFLTTYAAPFEY